jgi:ATP-dependent Lon protease
MLFRNDKRDPKDQPPSGGGLRVPLLPLRDIIVFPHMVVPLFVGRQKSIRALEEAMNKQKYVLLAAQKDAKTNDPAEDDIYKVGTLGTVVQLLRLPDGTVKVLVEGKKRARVVRYVGNPEFFLVDAEAIEEVCDKSTEVEALIRSVNSTFETYVKLNKKIPPEMIMSVASIDEPARLADTIVAHLGIKLEDKQTLLEMIPPPSVSRRCSASCGRRSRSSKSRSASVLGSRSRWRRPRRSTTSTSRCARSRRSSARRTSSRTRSRSSRRRSSRRRCRPRPGRRWRRS